MWALVAVLVVALLGLGSAQAQSATHFGTADLTLGPTDSPPDYFPRCTNQDSVPYFDFHRVVDDIPSRTLSFVSSNSETGFDRVVLVIGNDTNGDVLHHVVTDITVTAEGQTLRVPFHVLAAHSRTDGVVLVDHHVTPIYLVDGAASVSTVDIYRDGPLATDDHLYSGTHEYRGQSVERRIPGAASGVTFAELGSSGIWAPVRAETSPQAYEFASDASTTCHFGVAVPAPVPNGIVNTLGSLPTATVLDAGDIIVDLNDHAYSFDHLLEFDVPAGYQLGHSGGVISALQATIDSDGFFNRTVTVSEAGGTDAEEAHVMYDVPTAVQVPGGIPDVSGIDGLAAGSYFGGVEGITGYAFEWHEPAGSGAGVPVTAEISGSDPDTATIAMTANEARMYDADPVLNLTAAVPGGTVVHQFRFDAGPLFEIDIPEGILTLPPGSAHVAAPACPVDEVEPSITSTANGTGSIISFAFGTSPEFESLDYMLDQNDGTLAYQIGTDTRAVFDLVSRSGSGTIHSYVAGTDRDSGSLSSANLTEGQWNSADHSYNGADADPAVRGLDLRISLQHEGDLVAIRGPNGGGLYSPSPTGVPLYWYDGDVLEGRHVQQWLPPVPTHAASGTDHDVYEFGRTRTPDGTVIYVPTGALYPGSASTSINDPPRNIETESSTPGDPSYALPLSDDVWCHYAQAVANPAVDAPPLVSANGRDVIVTTEPVGAFASTSESSTAISYSSESLAVDKESSPPTEYVLVGEGDAAPLVLGPDIAATGFGLGDLRATWSYSINTTDTTEAGTGSTDRGDYSLELYPSYLHGVGDRLADHSLTAVLNVTHPAHGPGGSSVWSALEYEVLLRPPLTCGGGLYSFANWNLMQSVHSGAGEGSATALLIPGYLSNRHEAYWVGYEMTAGDWYLSGGGLFRAVDVNATEYSLGSDDLVWRDMDYVLDEADDPRFLSTTPEEDLPVFFRVSLTDHDVTDLRAQGMAQQAIASRVTCDP